MSRALALESVGGKTVGGFGYGKDSKVEESIGRYGILTASMGSLTYDGWNAHTSCIGSSRFLQG